MTDDELLDDNAAERAQAAALRDQAREGGLQFETFLPASLADWLLERIERGMFANPAEAVFAIFTEAREMEPHRDLRDEVLRRMIDAASANLESARPHDEVMAELREEMARPRPEPARWQWRA
jgi:Arc/MetJ-type ribon-helix-helix transcriptional regulator